MLRAKRILDYRKEEDCSFKVIPRLAYRASQELELHVSHPAPTQHAQILMGTLNPKTSHGQLTI